MKSRRLASAHCMSSKASTVGYDLRQPLEEEPPGGEQVLPLEALRLAEPEQLRQARLDEAALALVVEEVLLERLACSFARADAGSSSSAMRQRIRTMSASAQYVTPSP